MSNKHRTIILILTLVCFSGFAAKEAGTGNNPPSFNKQGSLWESNKRQPIGDYHQRELHSFDAVKTRVGPIAIFPCTSIIVLQNDSLPFEPEGLSRGPWGGQAKVSLTVQSPLPRWGVSIEASPFKGPEGILPPDRLWAQTEATENTFHPLNHPVPVLIGDPRLPVRQTSFDIKVQPSWSDKPGYYQGKIIAKPFLPQGTGISSAHNFRNEHLGGSQVLTVGLEIQEEMLVSFSQTEIKFDADVGPGVYPADEEVHFTVTTNASIWKVDCQAASLTGDKHKIPVERVSWERLNKLGKVEASGKLGIDETVVTGVGPAKDFEVRLRFKVQVMLEDPAGEYGGNISLVGITGG